MDLGVYMAITKWNGGCFRKWKHGRGNGQYFFLCCQLFSSEIRNSILVHEATPMFQPEINFFKFPFSAMPPEHDALVLYCIVV